MSEPMVRIDQLSFRYAAGETLALDHVSLAVDKGEFVVLTGPSGCGKSTLALAMGGYLAHQFKGEFEGTVEVADVDTLREPLYQVADVVGLVQQNPEDQFCTLRVDDEVAFGPENRCVEPLMIRQLEQNSLMRAQAQHLEGRLLDSLSGGEKQRVALASMLAGTPQLLILDEPTSSLDPQATQDVLAVLDNLRRERGLTLIVIEHKLDALMRFNPRIVRMAQGHIEQDHSVFQPTVPVVHAPSMAGKVAVELEGVSVTLEDHHALDNVTVDFHSGQLTALMGANGAGKTTLLRVIRGLQPVRRGCVCVLGQDVAKDTVSALAGRVGFMFQNPDHQLLSDTVQGDMAFGLSAQQVTQDALYHQQLLELAGLWELRNRHPFSLSYGQKRRLNLASLLAQKPQIILVDEPLIGQDPNNAQYVMGVLRAAADEGVCVIAALHAPGMVQRFADRVVFLAQGRIDIDAAPDAAFAALSSSGRKAFAGML